METIGLYLLKSAVWLTGFALVFLVVLRNERYFQLNRIYLLTGIVASVVFPFYTWHYAVIIPSFPVAEVSVSDLTAVAVMPVKVTLPVYWWFYMAGIALLFIRLTRQTWMVIRKLQKAGYVKRGPVKLVRTSEYAASFSFFSFVFVNPSTTDIEMKEIVNHESEHIQQRHWFDLLLVELLCMMQWFNPFVWIYSHLIRQNHEYLADEMALQSTSDPAIYRATLLNQMLGTPVISLANSFSYSLNKKRFKMMKKKIDSPFRKLKMLLVLPFMALVFYAFAEPEYIYSAPATSTEKITTIAEALNELNAPVALPADKPGKIVQDKQDKIVEGKVVNAVNENIRKEKNVVKGKVINPEGKPLPGTSVIIVGTHVGTITDKDGNFQLKDVLKDAELVFSFVGFQSVKVKPDFEKPMVIEMAKQNIGMDEVVVVGYGIAPSPPPLSPGYTVKTLGSENQPLIIIDGVEINKEIMDQIKPESIMSISVLKDKSATTVYGEKGKNGVILITSKKSGAASKPPEPLKSEQLTVTGSPIYVVVEEMPEFPGGEMALKKWIASEVKYPVEAMKNNIQGKVYVNFVVDVDGKVILAKIARGVDPLLDKEALRVTSALPLWKPGKQDGKAVAVSYTIPIQFALDNEPATVQSAKSGEKEVFVVVEEMPEFPGGELALRKFIAQSVKYPAEAQKAGIQGKVFVTFVVNSNGLVEGAKIARGIDPALDAEAIRVVSSLPAWIPGKQRGQAVNVSYTTPIEFKLQPLLKAK